MPLRPLHLLLPLLLLLPQAPAAARAETIVLAADEWCPVNCQPNDERPGFMVELAARILEPAGYRIEYRLKPWARALREARKGSIDGVIGAHRGDAPDFVFPERPLLRIAGGDLFVRRDSDWTYRGIPSLREIRLGVVRNYDYGEELNAYLADPANENRVDVVHGQRALERNLAKLLAGRIDAVAEARSVVLRAARDMGVADQIRFAGQTAPPADCHVAFSPALERSARLAQLLSDGVEEMRLTGEYQALLELYGLDDEP